MKNEEVSKSFPGIRGLIPVIGWICLLTLSAGAHGSESHDTPAAADSLQVLVDADSTTQVTLAEFQLALDSVYSGIAGTYRGIHPILKNSCYDCHSDQTVYPWYHSVPGIGGMIDHDIEEAKKHLDMSDGFPFGGHASQIGQLREIRKEIEKDGMPLRYYRWMHWGTAVEGARRDSLFNWIDSSVAKIELVHKRYSVPVPGE